MIYFPKSKIYEKRKCRHKLQFAPNFVELRVECPCCQELSVIVLSKEEYKLLPRKFTLDGCIKVRKVK